MTAKRTQIMRSLAGCLAATLGAGAMAETTTNTEHGLSYRAQTHDGVWSMASVLELYKLSGWRLLQVQRIWANQDWPNGDPATRHNAFTDLIRFKGHWYCVFRVGEDHSNKGRLRIIRSRDGETWDSVFFYQPEEPSVDVRDSKLAVTDDGQLVVLAYESYRFEPAKSLHSAFGIGRSMTWLSGDGEQWHGPNFSRGGENTWIWNGAWHKGTGYGVAYAGKNEGGALYRTKDGKEWELAAQNIFPKNAEGKHGGNEASLFFDPDDNAWMYLRNAAQLNGKHCNIGFSRPPYTDWDWSRQSYVDFGGPKMIRLSDGRVVIGGRIWGRNGGKGYGDSQTTLFELDLEDNSFHKIADLPSQGDNAYPGIVEMDGELWVSYYSCHEDPNPECRNPHTQRACIYLARLKIGGPRYGYPPDDRHALNPQPRP